MTKRQAISALRKVEGVVSGIVGDIAELTEGFQRQSGYLRLTLGMALDEGASLVSGMGEDWREWARANVADETPPTLYRIRNAGSVARVIGLDSIKPGTSYLACVPFYRYLKAAGTDAEALAAAHETIRALWAEAVKRAGSGWVTADLATEVAESTGQGTTRGKGAGDTEGAAKNRAAAKGRRKGKTATAEETAPAASDDPVQREACAKELERLLSKVDDSQIPLTKAGMLAGIKLAETFGLGVAFAVVKGRK